MFGDCFILTVINQESHVIEIEISPSSLPLPTKRNLKSHETWNTRDSSELWSFSLFIHLVVSMRYESVERLLKEVILKAVENVSQFGNSSYLDLRLRSLSQNKWYQTHAYSNNFELQSLDFRKHMQNTLQKSIIQQNNTDIEILIKVLRDCSFIFAPNIVNFFSCTIHCLNLCNINNT